MQLFLTIWSLAFLFTSHNIYRNLCAPYIGNFYLNILAYMAIFILGQSFWLLLDNKINKYLEYFVYIVLFTFIIMFFYYIIIDIVRLFYLKSNPQLLDIKVIIIAVLLGVYAFFNRYHIRITKYNIGDDLKLKIAFMSDLHIGDTGINDKILSKVVKKINDENVDIVILGGDIIERNPKYFTDKNYNEFFKQLKTKYGIYAILGNHEYYGGMPYEITETLENNGNIRVLNDEFVEFDNFILIGREDNTRNYYIGKRKSIDQILNGLKSEKYKIVADHNPAHFKDSVDSSINLQLSGHTHNGQFFPFNIIIKFFYEKPYGLLDKGTSKLITSSGLSTWRIPIKLMSKPEIVIVNI